MRTYDFCGWATKANMLCSDGRTIMKDAFIENDGQRVPLVWNHRHGNSEDVLGHADLENRPEGVYAYCTFNDTATGQNAKKLVEHGDITALSIYANKLQERGKNVFHGIIREVSLVLAGANPGANIDSYVYHSDGEMIEDREQGYIYTGENFELYHSDDERDKEEEINMANEKNGNINENEDMTIQDVIDTMTPEQQSAVCELLNAVINADEDDDYEDEDEEETEMKHNTFDNDYEEQNVLTHSDQGAILTMAKSNNCGSLQSAIERYSEDNGALAHGITDIESLFPDYEDLRKGAPEKLERDQGWVGKVMAGVHKSPISRIRTRQADVTGSDLTAFGYQKGARKANAGNIRLLNRTTDPQTVYRKDQLNRDDIIDITDFDVVEYLYGIMKQNLMEELAKAILVGDGRQDGDPNKIYEEHIRSIWHDDELYCIHADVNMEAMRNELQGTRTSARFGENYIYAEAIVQSTLYARERYKGSGNLTMFVDPHVLNVMLLARDMNGRRIYGSKAELQSALNVAAIQTVEQFASLGNRTDSNSNQHKLLAIFVNLSDYHLGSTKGGEITRFNQFDIDFNQEKYLIETRVSGALARVKSAIALELPIVPVTPDDTELDPDEPNPDEIEP